MDMSVQGVTLPFTGSAFDSDRGRIYVFRCLWEDYPIQGLSRNSNFDMSITGRLMGAGMDGEI